MGFLKKKFGMGGPAVPGAEYGTDRDAHGSRGGGKHR